MIKNKIKNYLGITDLEKRVDKIERDIELQLKHFGDYKNRTSSQLSSMTNEINMMIETIMNVIERQDCIEDHPRAKKLLKRLKIHKTLSQKAMNS